MNEAHTATVRFFQIYTYTQILSILFRVPDFEKGWEWLFADPSSFVRNNSVPIFQKREDEKSVFPVIPSAASDIRSEAEPSSTSSINFIEIIYLRSKPVKIKLKNIYQNKLRCYVLFDTRTMLKLTNWVISFPMTQMHARSEHLRMWYPDYK